MLAKSRSRIKRLVSRTKRKNGEGESRHNYESYRSNRHCKVHIKAEACLSTNGNALRKSGCNVRVRHSSLPLPGNEDMEPPTNSLFSSPVRSQSLPACTCGPPLVLENLCLYGHSTNSGDARRWQLIFDTPQRPLLEPIPACDKTAITSTIDLIAALALEPSDGSKRSTRESCTAHRLMATDISRNIWDLIRESDEAFRADEFALPSPKDPSQGWYLAEDDSMIILNSIDPPHVALKKHFHKLTKQAFPVFKSKPKNRRKSNLPQFKDTPPVSPTGCGPTNASSQRWRMAEVREGALDVFNEKVFHNRGNEAIGNIRRLEAKNSLEHDSNRSYETVDSSLSHCTDDSVTPVEPFHLDGLPARVTAAGVSSTDPESSDSPPPIPRRSGRRHAPNILTINAYSQQDFDLNALTPPLSPKDRNGLSGSYSPDLTTIPEIPSIVSGTPEANALIFGRQSTAPSRRRTTNLRRRRLGRYFLLARDREGKGMARNSADQRVLTSTPYSAISPSFRHGSIRLNPCLSSVPSPEQRNFQASTSGVSLQSAHLANSNIFQASTHYKRNPSLDWTAFQVAMSGAGGDHLNMNLEAMAMSSESYLIQEDLEREIDEIIEWWGGFGLDSGRLICQKSAEPDMLPNSLKYKPPYVDPNLSASIDLPAKFHGKYSREEDDGLSLQPSPMEDINLADLRRKGSQYVPMDRNLHHDLRDYLRWRGGFAKHLASDSDREEVGVKL